MGARLAGGLASTTEKLTGEARDLDLHRGVGTKVVSLDAIGYIFIASTATDMLRLASLGAHGWSELWVGGTR